MAALLLSRIGFIEIERSEGLASGSFNNTSHASGMTECCFPDLSMSLNCLMVCHQLLVSKQKPNHFGIPPAFAAGSGFCLTSLMSPP